MAKNSLFVEFDLRSGGISSFACRKKTRMKLSACFPQRNNPQSMAAIRPLIPERFHKLDSRFIVVQYQTHLFILPIEAVFQGVHALARSGNREFVASTKRNQCFCFSVCHAGGRVGWMELSMRLRRTKIQTLIPNNCTRRFSCLSPIGLHRWMHLTLEKSLIDGSIPWVK